MDNQNNNFPWEIKDVEPKLAEELMSFFTGKYNLSLEKVFNL